MDTFSSPRNALHVHDENGMPSPSSFLQARSFSRTLAISSISSCLFIPTPPPNALLQETLRDAQPLEHKEQFEKREDKGVPAPDSTMKIPQVIHVHCDDNVSVLGWGAENVCSNAFNNSTKAIQPMPIYHAEEGYLQSRRNVALFRADEEDEVEEEGGDGEGEGEEGKGKENDKSRDSKVNKTSENAKGVRHYLQKKRLWFRGGSRKRQGYYSIDKGGRFLYEI